MPFSWAPVSVMDAMPQNGSTMRAECLGICRASLRFDPWIELDSESTYDLHMLHASPAVHGRLAPLWFLSHGSTGNHRFHGLYATSATKAATPTMKRNPYTGAFPSSSVCRNIAPNTETTMLAMKAQM